MSLKVDAEDMKTALLTRQQLHHELNERGYPISLAYLNRLCLPSRNQGPPATKQWGRRPLYDLAAGIAWAEARCTTPATAA
jgi:hypothetical protein